MEFNLSTGIVEVAGGTLKTAQIGQGNAAGAPVNASRLGYGDILLTSAGRIFYNGAGEESDKPIVLADSVAAHTTPKPSYVPTGVVEQAGMGLLRMTTPVRVDCASATLRLASSVETPAEWAGVLADTDADHVLGLEKTGTGAWTISAANTYTGPMTLTCGPSCATRSSSRTRPAAAAASRAERCCLSVEREDAGGMIGHEVRTHGSFFVPAACFLVVLAYALVFRKDKAS